MWRPYSLDCLTEFCLGCMILLDGNALGLLVITLELDGHSSGLLNVVLLGLLDGLLGGILPGLLDRVCLGCSMEGIVYVG